MSTTTSINMTPVPATETSSIRLTADELVDSDSESVISQVVAPSSFTTTKQYGSTL